MAGTSSVQSSLTQSYFGLDSCKKVSEGNVAIVIAEQEGINDHRNPGILSNCQYIN
jgi:hypothetical protein